MTLSSAQENIFHIYSQLFSSIFSSLLLPSEWNMHKIFSTSQDFLCKLLKIILRRTLLECTRQKGAVTDYFTVSVTGCISNGLLETLRSECSDYTRMVSATAHTRPKSKVKEISNIKLTMKRGYTILSNYKIGQIKILKLDIASYKNYTKL